MSRHLGNFERSRFFQNQATCYIIQSANLSLLTESYYGQFTLGLSKRKWRERELIPQIDVTPKWTILHFILSCHFADATRAGWILEHGTFFPSGVGFSKDGLRYSSDNSLTSGRAVLLRLIHWYQLRKLKSWGGGEGGVNPEKREQKTHTTRYLNTIILKFILHSVARTYHLKIKLSYLVNKKRKDGKGTLKRTEKDHWQCFNVGCNIKRFVRYHKLQNSFSSLPKTCSARGRETHTNRSFEPHAWPRLNTGLSLSQGVLYTSLLRPFLPRFIARDNETPWE